jgi:NADPH:quinone reductase-like Zn-dependent oxidoreductase
MKTVLYRAHGEVDRLEFTDVPTPQPGPGEVLVRVAACGLNHLDVLQRRGPALIPGYTLPHIAGMDVAGVIESCGPGVEGCEQGDRVVVNPAIGCGECADCLRGMDGRCSDAQVIGGNIAGGYA